MIIIGLGTGRSGTASLAHLLNSQRDALCFHEMNPSSMRWSGTPHPVLSAVRDMEAVLDGGDPARLTVDLSRKVAADAYDQLRTMPRVSLIGDIALYYLTYVETIASASDRVRFVCLKRDREATVESWLKKSSLGYWRSKAFAMKLASLITREPYTPTRNFWMDHDGTRWQPDPVWDKVFPKMSGPTRRAAIGQYWDMYYGEAERLAALLPDVFRIVETEQLEDPAFQADLLTFCGVADIDHIYTDAHRHKSA